MIHAQDLELLVHSSTKIEREKEKEKEKKKQKTWQVKCMHLNISLLSSSNNRKDFIKTIECSNQTIVHAQPDCNSSTRVRKKTF